MKKLLVTGMVSLSILLVAVTMIGCQQSAAPSPPEVEQVIPSHFTTYTDEASLFSISYPSDWELALSLIEGLEQATKELFKSIESDLPLEISSTIFFAGVPNEIGYQPNVNIIVESLPGGIWTLDEYVEEGRKVTKDMIQDYHELSRLKTTIDGREATIVEWEGTFPQLGSVHVLQMATLVGKVAWTVTCGPPAEDFSEWEEDFYHIVRSLRILK